MPDVETIRIEKVDDLSQPFVAAGDRAYLVGAQDGSFPPLGWHTRGEMGGLWAHPIKLLDGFWLEIDGEAAGKAFSFTVEPFATSHEFVLGGGVGVTRRQYVPDGVPALCVRYTVRSEQERHITARLMASVDLRGVWPRDEPGAFASSFVPELGAWVCGDDPRRRYVVVGARCGENCARPVEAGSSESHATTDTNHLVALELDLDIGPRAGIIDFTVAGSSHSLPDAARSFTRARDNAESLWEQKQERYEGLLGRSALDVPDASLRRAWTWVKCDYDWLVRDVPGIGRGITAGLEEYPWWFGCDSWFAVLGALALGQHEAAISTLDLIRSRSPMDGPDAGRVIHECTSSGVVVHPGNVQETPRFVTAVWQTFCWTGNRAFLERSYEFCRLGLLSYTLGRCCRGDDLLPYGYGITEREGLDLQCVDAAASTAAAAAALASMAEEVGDEAVAARCRQLAPTLREALQSFWLEEEGLYGDMLATPREMVPRLQRWLALGENLYYGATRAGAARDELQSLLRRAETDSEPDRKRPWLLKHWIVLSPVATCLAPPDRARRVLERLESPEFTGPEGLFISGLDRAHAMSISTGVMAAAEAAHGRPDVALRYVRALTDCLESHMPGGISEITPDGGCFLQAWSGYGVAWPVAAHIFGIRPAAGRRHLDLHPCFPPGWSGARLANVRIGDSTFDFEWDGAKLAVDSSRPGWTIAETSHQGDAGED